MPSILNKPLLVIIAMLSLLCAGIRANGDDVDHLFDMTEQNWNEDGDIEFDGVFIDNGSNSWGNVRTTDFYMQTTSGNAVTDIYLPTAQVVNTDLSIKIEFDARYLTSDSHNYLGFGNDADLENAIWFGFNNERFFAGTGTELAVSNNEPNADLVKFSTARTLANDTRIGVRVGYDIPNQSLRNFQIDMDNDGNHETELLDAPIDLSDVGLAPEDWYFVSYFGGEGARIDDVALAQLDLYGDYNRDFDFDSEDMELICSGIREGNTDYDYDQNGAIDSDDLDAFLKANGSLMADFDFNGLVEFADFLILSASFGKQDAAYGDGDVTCNGAVGFDDFLILSANFNRLARRAPSTAAVPEPTSLLLFAVALFGLGSVTRVSRKS